MSDTIFTGLDKETLEHWLEHHKIALSRARGDVIFWEREIGKILDELENQALDTAGTD